jgi:hypothetical protein
MQSSLDTVTHRVYDIKVNQGQAALTVTRVAPCKYRIEAFSQQAAHHTHLGYALEDCGPAVENLDFSSDGYDCFRISDSVKVRRCVFGPEYIKAPILVALQEAAAQLAVTTYDCQDI